MVPTQNFIKRLRAAPNNTAGLRAERKRISKEVTTLDRGAVIALAHNLIQAGVPRFVAYELIMNHEPAMNFITLAEVEELGQGMTHWGEVDPFACFIAGQAWRRGRMTDRAIQAWARSQDWFWRRTALVATVPLNSRAQGGGGDTKRTLAVCRILAADRDDMVVKALSWALRELAKHDPESVRNFLQVCHEELAARVVREVNNKLTTGLKNPGR